MVTAALARRVWREVEPVHAMIYFVPEGAEAYARAGVTDAAMGYFGSRAAALGRVPAEVVTACFFNFNPELVRHAIPAAWDIASPEVLLAARLEAADAALRRGAGTISSTARRWPRRPSWPGGPRRRRATCRRGVRSSPRTPRCPGRTPAPRALARADAAAGVPRRRAHRGAGPVRSHRAGGQRRCTRRRATGPARFLRGIRAWSHEQWNDTIERFRADGLILTGDELALTEAGKRLKQGLEDRTDEACRRAVRRARRGGLRAAARARTPDPPRDPRRGPAARGAVPRYLSMSPTTKNIEPRMATMSATRWPGSISASTWMLLNDAERSFSRHGVFSPCETR